MVTANRPYQPQQGDIIKISFDPALGHEQLGWRPALIVSQPILSTTSPFIWVVPISHGQYAHPLHVKLDDRTKVNGTIFVEQLKSFDYLTRKVVFIEKAPRDIIGQVLANIRQTLS